MAKSDIDSENKDIIDTLVSNSGPDPDSSLGHKCVEETDSLTALKQIAPGEIIIGTLTGIDAIGKALVSYPDAHVQDVTALSTVEINHKHIGRQVALLFANGDPGKPVVMGLIHSPLQEMLENFEISPTDSAEEGEYRSADSHEDAHIDGKRIVLEGKEEIVLKCGDASITLTKEGKIIIRGKYLLNRSSGVNRIMGGSVQVN